jgi:hypothetical protein
MKTLSYYAKAVMEITKKFFLLFHHTDSSPPKAVTPRTSNNNNYDHEEGPLKIDEDIDPGKENRMDSPVSVSNDDDIAEVTSNGVSSDEEEEAMPGPGGVELADPPSKIDIF